MEEEKPQIHIGVIGSCDHSKKTLTEAIRITMENKNREKENEQKAIRINIDNMNQENEKNIKNGGLGMSRRVGNYVGSTILGYRLVVDRAGSRRNKYIKKSQPKVNDSGLRKIKVPHKRRDFSK